MDCLHRPSASLEIRDAHPSVTIDHLLTIRILNSDRLCNRSTYFRNLSHPALLHCILINCTTVRATARKVSCLPCCWSVACLHLWHRHAYEVCSTNVHLCRPTHVQGLAVMLRGNLPKLSLLRLHRLPDAALRYGTSGILARRLNLSYGYQRLLRPLGECTP